MLSAQTLSFSQTFSQSTLNWTDLTSRYSHDLAQTHGLRTSLRRFGLVAMQKVVGSSPIIRSQNPRKSGVFGKRSARCRDRGGAPKLVGMERVEAEAILDGDRETAVALLLRIGELVEANERLEARVAELERRLNRSSRNSSLPPSQDPPSAPPRPRRTGSGRTRGGQPGHEGRHRRLLPPEQVDEIVEHWPGAAASVRTSSLSRSWLTPRSRGATRSPSCRRSRCG